MQYECETVFKKESTEVELHMIIGLTRKQVLMNEGNF